MPWDVNSIAQAEDLTAKITSEAIDEIVGEIGDLIEESFFPESSANKPQPPARNNQQNNKRGK